MSSNKTDTEKDTVMVGTEIDTEMTDTEMTDTEMTDTEMTDTEMTDTEMTDTEMTDTEGKESTNVGILTQFALNDNKSINMYYINKSYSINDTIETLFVPNLNKLKVDYNLNLPSNIEASDSEFIYFLNRLKDHGIGNNLEICNTPKLQDEYTIFQYLHLNMDNYEIIMQDEFKNYINSNCQNNIIILPIILFLKENTQINVIIIDNNSKTIEYVEPNAFDNKIYNNTHAYLEYYLKSSFQFISSYKYSHHVLINDNNTSNEFNILWCLYIIWLKISNGYISISVIENYIKSQSVDDNLVSLQILAGFILYIKKQIKIPSDLINNTTYVNLIRIVKENTQEYNIIKDVLIQRTTNVYNDIQKNYISYDTLKDLLRLKNLKNFNSIVEATLKSL